MLRYNIGAKLSHLERYSTKYISGGFKKYTLILSDQSNLIDYCLGSGKFMVLFLNVHQF